MGTSPTIRANDSVPSAMANASCFMSLLFLCFGHYRPCRRGGIRTRCRPLTSTPPVARRKKNLKYHEKVANLTIGVVARRESNPKYTIMPKASA